jgi:hypothetical protein
MSRLSQQGTREAEAGEGLSRNPFAILVVLGWVAYLASRFISRIMNGE